MPFALCHKPTNYRVTEDSTATRYTATRLYGYKVVRLQGYTATRLYGYKVVWLYRHTVTRLHGYKLAVEVVSSEVVYRSARTHARK